tara:strand:- start:182 stop:427 length:246 start_codon:yes stop_codon:yes gene_type:complete
MLKFLSYTKFFSKLFIICLAVCGLSSMPIFLLSFANDFFQPEVMWTREYNNLVPCLLIFCITLGIITTLKFDNFFEKFLRG